MFGHKIIDKILIDQRYRPKNFSPHEIERNFVYKPTIICILKCRNIKSATCVFKKNHQNCVPFQTRCQQRWRRPNSYLKNCI